MNPWPIKVEQPAGRGDQNIDALLQGPRLRILADAAKDHRVPQTGVTPVGVEALADLRGQFTGGSEDQHARAAAAAPRRLSGMRQAVQDGEREGRRLSRARLRAAQQIAAGHHARNRLRWDRGRRGVALENDGTQDGLGEPEFFKCHARSLGRIPGPEE
jgi:hypothetical protein